MIKITVPATSANLGPGFDCLGIALNLYNTFYFEKTEDDFVYINMPEKYCNRNNLIVRSSLETYKYLNIDPIYYSISNESDVPIARGLGSSATCIAAGILAAVKFSGKDVSTGEMISIASKIEGHPDNTTPALIGGLVSCVNSKEVLYNKYLVDNSLRFTVVIPPFKLSTNEARGVLPKTLGYEDIVYSMSRAINIPKALEEGNLEMLYYLLRDKLHQPYRFDLIKGSKKYLNFSKKNKLPFCISGSGSTMLFISNESIVEKLEKINDNYTVIELKVDNGGAKVEE